MTISRKIGFSICAVSRSISLFAATIPPKILVLSASYAFFHASAIVLPVALPHGFMCFTPTQNGSSNSRAMFNVALASCILLYDNSLPFSCSAVARRERLLHGACEELRLLVRIFTITKLLLQVIFQEKLFPEVLPVHAYMSKSPCHILLYVYMPWQKVSDGSHG